MSKKIPIYEVSDQVPIPVRGNMPFLLLKVGESFAAPLERRPSVQTVASRIKAESGRTFTIKKVSDTEIRIWRVS